MKNIAVFVSGGGSNFRAIHNQILSGNIPGEIVLVVSNNPIAEPSPMRKKIQFKFLL